MAGTGLIVIFWGAPIDPEEDTDTTLQGLKEPGQLTPARNPTRLRYPLFSDCFSHVLRCYLHSGREGSWRRCPSMQPKLQDLAAQLTISINSPPKLKYCNAFGLLQVLLVFFSFDLHHPQPESPSQGQQPPATLEVTRAADKPFFHR